MSSEIRSYTFDKAGLNQVRQAPRGKNWPVVYLIHDDNNLYIGETTSASTRMDQHLKNEAKKDLKVIEFIFDPSSSAFIRNPFANAVFYCILR